MKGRSTRRVHHNKRITKFAGGAKKRARKSKRMDNNVTRKIMGGAIKIGFEPFDLDHPEKTGSKVEMIDNNSSYKAIVVRHPGRAMLGWNVLPKLKDAQKGFVVSFFHFKIL